MRRFKYIGTAKLASEYSNPRPNLGYTYDEDEIISGGKAIDFATHSFDGIMEEWQEVFDEQAPTPDPVNPQHYKNGEVECIDAIKSAVVGKDGYSSVLVANVIKYLWRYESKGGVKDIEKASWYLNKLVEYEKGKIT